MSYDFNAPAYTDITINFSGTTYSGQFKWMENDDRFEFVDNLWIKKSRPHYVLYDTGTSYCSADMYTNEMQNYLRFGIESSSGGGLVTGSEAYEAIFYNSGSYPIGLWTNATRRLRIGGDGKIDVGGDFRPVTDNTYYLGKNDDDSPQAWKGLILKDQAGTGKYYRLEVYNNALRIVDLTDEE